MRMLLIVVALVSAVLAQERTVLDGRPVVVIANDKLTLSVRIEGGAMVRLVLNDDPDAVNPMHARLGHFVCVDGFGPVSPEERKAGLPGHGEANRVTWDVVSSEKSNGTTTVAFSATLPIVQEKFRRTIRSRRRRAGRLHRKRAREPARIRSADQLGRARHDRPALPRAGQDHRRDVGDAIDDALARISIGDAAAPARVIQGIHLAHRSGTARGIHRCANHADRDARSPITRRR